MCNSGSQDDLWACATLLAASLAEGVTRLTGWPRSRRIVDFIAKLGTFGVTIRDDPLTGRIEIRGTAGGWPRLETQYSPHALGESPAQIALLLPTLALTGAGATLLEADDTAAAAMTSTDLQLVLQGLHDLGATCVHDLDQHSWHIPGKGLAGGHLHLDGGSRWVTAIGLLLIAPLARQDVFVQCRQPMPTEELARLDRLMSAFGVSMIREDGDRLIIPAPQLYRGPGDLHDPLC